MTENQISIEFTSEEMEKIRGAISVLHVNLLPKLRKIDSGTKRELPKMGDRTIGFVSKSIELASTHQQFVPQYVDISEAQKDYSAVSILREFSVELNKFAEMVDDTMTLSGSEAYSAALMFYAAAKNAAKSNQPGAQIIYDQLKERFPRNAYKTRQETAAGVN